MQQAAALQNHFWVRGTTELFKLPRKIHDGIVEYG